MDLLLNWLWQGCALVLAGEAIVRVVPRASAATRHHLWWLALLLVLSLPFLGWIGDDATAGERPAGTVVVEVMAGVGWLSVLFASGWLMWVAIAASRLLHALVWLRSARNACRTFPRDREDRLPHWALLRDSGRRATLVVCDDIRAASVLGLGSPLIALAPATVDELDDCQLDRIVIHEWAHVQRRDDFLRMLQRVVGVVAGIHPAVWWIGRRIDVEGEIACDDRVVEITGGARAYAATLVKLAAVPAQGRRFALMAGVLSTPGLSTRIVRLLDARRRISTRPSPAALSLLAPVMLAVALHVANIELVVSAEPALSPPGNAAVPTEADPSAGTPASAVNATRHGIGRPVGAVPRERQPRMRKARKPAPPEPASLRGVSAMASSRDTLSRFDPPSRAVTGGQGTEEGGAFSPAPAPGLAESPGVASFPGEVVLMTMPPAGSRAASNGGSPWSAAAGAGAAVGRGSERAAVATAGFFTRASKKLAGSF